jgi:hypothetical protein
MKKIISLILVFTFVFLLAACGNGNGGSDVPKPPTDVDCDETPNHADCVVDEEPTTIRLGHHWVAEIDPTWVDPLTGEGYMAEDSRLAGLHALEVVLEELNVEIEFVEYSGDIREQFLQSVIAQDPVAEIVLMWGGSQNTILGQNVLQDLNPYVENGVFEGNEWALASEIFGKYKFMNLHLGNDGTGFTEWPLVYNVTMIDQCPGAKAIGNPSTLWVEGNWTWDTMEDMLEALYVCYDGVPGIERPEYEIIPFSTDIRYAMAGFLASNGEYAVRPDGTLGYESQATVEAVELFQDWYDRGLMSSSFWNDLSNEPGWLWDSDNFGYGETVFTTCASWLVESEGAWMAARGEKMGIVPYPVGPSATETGSTQYRSPNTPANQWGLLKGVDAETSELAIRATLLYFEEYYKTLGNVPTVDDYWEALYEDVAHRMFDTLNPDHGQDIVQALKDQMATSQNGVDMASTYGVWDEWTALLGDLMKGFKQDYQTEYAKMKPGMNSTLDSLSSIIVSDTIRDTNGPTIEGQEGVLLVFPVNTDLAVSNFEFEGNGWEYYLNVTDNMSIIDYSTIEFEFKLNVYDNVDDLDKVTSQITEGIDFSVPGRYQMIVTAEDDNGNSSTQDFTVVIYDDQNTTAPTLSVKDVVYNEVVGADLSEYNWGSYISEARDFDLIPIWTDVVADMSNINATSPGEYDVVLTVTDYVGNTTSGTVKFRIYDDQETERPTLTAKNAGPLEFVVDTTFISIDWSEYFDATDTLGGSTPLDISSRIILVDYGTLDSSTPGSYTITLKVVDYAGNETTLEVGIDIISE